MRVYFVINVLSFAFENMVLREGRSLMWEVAHEGFHCRLISFSSFLHKGNFFKRLVLNAIFSLSSILKL